MLQIPKEILNKQVNRTNPGKNKSPDENKTRLCGRSGDLVLSSGACQSVCPEVKQTILLILQLTMKRWIFRVSCFYFISNKTKGKKLDENQPLKGFTLSKFQFDKALYWCVLHNTMLSFLRRVVWKIFDLVPGNIFFLLSTFSFFYPKFQSIEVIRHFAHNFMNNFGLITFDFLCIIDGRLASRRRVKFYDS